MLGSRTAGQPAGIGLLAAAAGSAAAVLVAADAALHLAGVQTWISCPHRSGPLPSLHTIPAVSCAWGYTTTGGAKGVGESTTSAVVISLVLIFVFDFALSFLFFQGQGDALRSCM